MHALDLVGPVSGVAHESHLGDVLDDQARATAREEREALVAQLSAVGLSERGRPAPAR